LAIPECSVFPPWVTRHLWRCNDYFWRASFSSRARSVWHKVTHKDSRWDNVDSNDPGRLSGAFSMFSGSGWL